MSFYSNYPPILKKNYKKSQELNTYNSRRSRSIPCASRLALALLSIQYVFFTEVSKFLSPIPLWAQGCFFALLNGKMSLSATTAPAALWRAPLFVSMTMPQDSERILWGIWEVVSSHVQIIKPH